MVMFGKVRRFTLETAGAAFPNTFLLRENFVDFLFHGFRSEWFDDVVGHAGLSCFNNIRLLCFSRDHEKGQMPIILTGTNLAQQFDTCHLRHVPVGNDEIDMIFIQDFPRCGAVICFHHII